MLDTSTSEGADAGARPSAFRRLREGFHPSFWVVNVLELFERLAYYGQAAVLSVFLRDELGFNAVDAGTLTSVFGGLIYLLPIFAGTLADRYGFRRALAAAFAGLSVGYFAIGAAGTDAFASALAGIPLFWLMAGILVFTAAFGALIKPAVLGTIAKTSTAETKSLGYAIYYMLVNVGGAVGPLIAFFVRGGVGFEWVFFVSAITCALTFFSTLAFFREPPADPGVPVATLARKVRDMLAVLGNGRFMIFLLIFSLYWIMFWQIFVIVPFYIVDFISKDAPFEVIGSADAWTVIVVQVAVNRLTRRLRPIQAIVLGFGVSSLCWLIIAANPTVWVIIAGIVVFALGEVTQAPRYYEYIADRAPKGQEATFQGYAFLPVAIGWLVAGRLGGRLYETFASPLLVREGDEVVRTTGEPTEMWLVVAGIGILATVLMWLYDRVFGHGRPAAAGMSP